MANAVLPDGLRERYVDVYEQLLASYAQEVTACEHANETSHPEKAAPSHPYLISAPPNYCQSDYKVMVVGQETRGWCRHKEKGRNKHYHFTKENATVEQLLELYALGFHDPNHLRWSGTFRTGFNMLRDNLMKQFGCDSSQMSFIFNNVIKIGKHKGSGRPCSCVIKWQQESGCLELLRDEICKHFLPTHIVFFCGPNYDHYLDQVFPGLKRERVSEVFTERQVATLSSRDLGGIKAVRTYHPGYLKRQGKDAFNAYIAAVTKSLV